MLKKNMVFKKNVVMHALVLAFGGSVLTVGVVPTVMAQSNATGSIVGSVDVPANSSIIVRNVETGAKRTIEIESNGRYSATSMPIGHYKVELIRSGAVVQTREVDVVGGGGADASFVTAQTVSVTGQRTRIDVTNTNNGSTFSAKELAKLPVGRNVESIIQLAPNTTKVDSRFDGGASFGGGAASENSYYINGFPVVNPLTGLGASQLPFGAIAQAQVLTGGFGAEFGRSVGGVVNVITKSGTNRWETGAMLTFSPKSLRARPIDFYYQNIGEKYTNGEDGKPKTDGTMRFSRRNNTVEEKSFGAYVGGPIIEDKLFMYLAGEETRKNEGTVNNSRVAPSNADNGWRDRQTKTQRYMAKFDWNIADDHRLEWTSLGDTPVEDTQYYGYDYETQTRGHTQTSSRSLKNINSNGGLTNMFKYTGNLTKDLTLTALAGQTSSEHSEKYPGYNPTLFSVVTAKSDQAPGLTYTNPQPITGNILAPGSKDVVKSMRLDLEYKLASHTIRGGLDVNKIDSIKAGVNKAGGGTWTYQRTDTPTIPLKLNGGIVPPIGLAGGGPLATDGYYVVKGIFTTVTTAYGEQNAQYLEDRWQVTKDVMLVGGLRREAFANLNDAKEKFLEMKNQINPRFAASWDVNGDSSFKVFGTAGRYSVPIPTHISVRFGGVSTFTSQYFTYTGVDPSTGAPTGLKQLTEPLSPNNELGQDKDVKTLSALNLKPSYQDEITVGFEKAFSSELNFGAKATYRTLKSTIDDFCDVRPFAKWAARNNVAITNPQWGNTCQAFNPGENNTFYIDFVGGGKNDTLVALTAADQGFDKAKRTYTALDFFLEHPLRDGWYGKVNYTWARNKGNTEGQVRSDNGQQDVATTSVWDYPEGMVGKYGVLPNDRTHQIKAFGFYEISKEFGVGANLLVATGRPRSCFGSDPHPGDSPNYANGTAYCGTVLVPRGSVGRLPTEKTVDLSFDYRPAQLEGMLFRFDIFNAFNSQTVQNVTEAYNNGTRRSALYGIPLSATAPRSMRLSVGYDHKF